MRTMVTLRPIVFVCALCLLACSSKSSAPAGGESAKEPAAVPGAPQAAPAVPPPAPAAPRPAAGDSDEACARVVVIAYKGAQPPTEGVTRDKASAEAEARGYLEKLNAGSDFGATARGHSDAPTSAKRNGYLGTFERADWPAMHAPIRDAVYRLAVGGFADAPIETSYGYVVLQRCPVEKAHARHILIRYKGAERAPKSVTRSKAEAQKLATKLLEELGHGADFAALAKSKSEDSSAERGGDIGVQARGRLAPAFDNELFELPLGGQSQIVETEMGFHIIQRLPE
jgi:hypothetical protein